MNSPYTPESLMRLAIEKALEGMERGQSPFGCAIALGERLIACDHNGVLAGPDATAHAEITALRSACRNEGHYLLEGALVASTCEPCPMCMAALHWARVDTVVYGASIDDAAAAGFNELAIPAAQIVQLGRSRVQLQGGVLREECRALFDRWKERPDAVAY